MADRLGLRAEAYAMQDPGSQTLPDYLKSGLTLVFVGINPSVYSAQRGHYFARPTNRFWPAFSRSRLRLPIRQALSLDALKPEHDAALLDYGIGFTDLVKQPSAGAASITQSQFAEGAQLLRSRLESYQPKVAAFHGLTAYRPFARYSLSSSKPTNTLGLQTELVADTHLFVVPNPSPANAHFKVSDQADWYDRLADFIERVNTD
jgi:TDG/mug DNA glycosylase family protein